MTVPVTRPLTAGRLLTIRREVREETEDPMERAALANARVLAEGCFGEDGQPLFPDARAVLEQMTFPEMEEALCAMTRGGPRPAGENPNFDRARFSTLRRGGPRGLH